MEASKGVRPLSVLPTVGLFAVPAAILYVTHYVWVPSFVASSGYPYLVGYLVGWGGTMALFFLAALVAYRLEGNPIAWQAFRTRYRLGSMGARDWVWTLGILVFSAATYFGLSFTTEWLAQVPAFAPHPSFPPEFGPSGTSAHVPGALMGMDLAGKWWVAALFPLGWFFNIFGEEFWFRGYILPRQELAFGRAAWVVHGVMFGLNHVWQPWNLLLILPGAIAGAYVVQRRRNTWILIVSHGLMNATLVVVVLLNVLGVRV